MATIFTDAIGSGIIMPVLPQLVMEVGRLDLPHAIRVKGRSGSSWRWRPFPASPVLGNGLTWFGRRRCAAVVACRVSPLTGALLTITDTLASLFVARAVGDFRGYYAAAMQEAIVDVTRPQERAHYFVGAFGVGFVVGPAIGGFLGDVVAARALCGAALVAAANMIYGAFIFPETLAPDKRRGFDWRRANPLGAFEVDAAQVCMRGRRAAAVADRQPRLSDDVEFLLYRAARLDAGMIGASLAAVGAHRRAACRRPMVARFGDRWRRSAHLRRVAVVPATAMLCQG